MSAFPGAGAVVHYNEAGEPTGWDYPSDDEPDYDDDPYADREYKADCPGGCGATFWSDDEDAIIEHHEWCEGPTGWSLADLGIDLTTTATTNHKET